MRFTMQFEELKLPIASLFDVILIGQDYKRHQCRAKLIGYQKPQRLILELVNKPPQVLLHQGLKIEAAISLALGYAYFETEIDELVSGSSPYLVLAYPSKLDYTAQRSEPRMPVDQPIEVVGKTALGMDTSTMHGHILDVSCAGARIVVEKELTAMVTQISLGVMLSLPSLERDMTIMAKVVKASAISSDHPDYPFAYGLRFVGLPAIDSYFLQAFCYQMELQGRQLLCSAPRLKI
tara:strand:- start:91573 stop:92280 length:708 start_codon:yes stop_codon:yes gene_type:complete